MTRPLRTPEMKEAGVAAPARSDALVSTLSLATVPQNLDVDEAEFDIPRYLMAALAVSDDVRVLAISHNFKASDLGYLDSVIFGTMLALARKGIAPALPLVQAELARQGLFGDHHGPQLQNRMLAIVTTSASPLQIDQLALAILDSKFRDMARAMGEGIYDAADKYAIHALMPYTRDLGTQLAAIDRRRMALGGESQ